MRVPLLLPALVVLACADDARSPAGGAAGATPEPDSGTTPRGLDTGCGDLDDDDFASATPLAPGVTATRTILEPGDIDTFAYTVSRPSWVRVVTESEYVYEYGYEYYGESEPVGVSVYDPDEDRHLTVGLFPQFWRPNVSGWYPSCLQPFDVYLPRAGTWYLTVGEGLPGYDAYYAYLGDDCSFRYTIRVDPVLTAAEPDAFDAPAASLDVADPCELTGVHAALEVAGDSDYARLTVAEDHSFLSFIGHDDAPGSTARPRLRLYDEAGALLMSKDDLGAGGEAAVFDLAAGEYVLEATDADGAGGEAAWFTAYASVHGNDVQHPLNQNTYVDELEPNDNEALAVPLGTPGVFPWPNQFVDGWFQVAGDEDWFVLDVEADELVYVWCWSHEFGSLALPQVALFQDGADLTPPGAGLAADDEGDYLCDVPVPASGQAYLRITTQGDAFGQGAYYRCSLSAEPWSHWCDWPESQTQALRDP